MSRTASEWVIEKRSESRERFIRFNEKWEQVWRCNALGRVFATAREAAQFAQDAGWSAGAVRIVELPAIDDALLEDYLQ